MRVMHAYSLIRPSSIATLARMPSASVSSGPIQIGPRAAAALLRCIRACAHSRSRTATRSVIVRSASACNRLTTQPPARCTAIHVRSMSRAIGTHRALATSGSQRLGVFEHLCSQAVDLRLHQRGLALGTTAHVALDRLVVEPAEIHAAGAAVAESGCTAHLLDFREQRSLATSHAVAVVDLPGDEAAARAVARTARPVAVHRASAAGAEPPGHGAAPTRREPLGALASPEAGAVLSISPPIPRTRTLCIHADPWVSWSDSMHPHREHLTVASVCSSIHSPFTRPHCVSHAAHSMSVADIRQWSAWQRAPISARPRLWRPTPARPRSIRYSRAAATH